LQSAPDQHHIAYALPEGRVILTEDKDDLVLSARGVPHARIAYCHQQTQSVGEIIDVLILIWETYEPEEIAGRVEYL
jgi:hypothetical protein